MYSLKVLDHKDLNDREWVLCKGNLNDYLNSLKPEFYNFSIQRKIIENQYLDTLVSTVKDGDPLPMITLTHNSPRLNIQIGGDMLLDMHHVEILDGLQRTFRLWAHNQLVKEFYHSGIDDPGTFAKVIKEKYPIFFDTGIVTYGKIKNLFENNEFETIRNAYSNFEVYFIVWLNLSPKRVIHKMLVLNAGQKSVTITHQFELLFLYLWEDLQKELKGEIRLFREKDKEAFAIKRGKREVGDYLFSSIIVGLRSFIEKKPVRVSVDDLDVTELLNESSEFPLNENIFNPDFITIYLRYLKDLDAAVVEKYGEEGSKWFVKDTTLSGLLAGIGSFAEIHDEFSTNMLIDSYVENIKRLIDKVYTFGLNLEQFTAEYNMLSSRSVNIGYFIRNVIKDYTVKLLSGNNPTWSEVFSSNYKKA